MDFARCVALVVCAVAVLVVLQSPASAKKSQAINMAGTHTIFYNPNNGHVVYRGKYALSDKNHPHLVTVTFQFYSRGEWHPVKRLSFRDIFWSGRDFRFEHNLSGEDIKRLSQIDNRRSVRLLGILNVVGSTNERSEVTTKTIGRVLLDPLPANTFGYMTTQIAR